MKLWEIVSNEGIDGLVLNERRMPEPRYGEVLVDVRASSINYRDLLTVENPILRSIKLPMCPNSDCAGEVIAIGEGVQKFSVGDRVMGCFFQRWSSGGITSEAMTSALGGALPGVLAEKVLLIEDAIVKIPDHLNFNEAATLPCAAVTAWHAMVCRRRVNVGERILILGTGGVSVFAQQFANILGAETIVISSDNKKLERIAEIGASKTINYKDTPEWDQAVLDLTDGFGVDHIIEVGGAGTLEKSISAIRVGGHIALIGILTGIDGQIVPTGLMRKSLTLSGIYVGSREMFEDMVKALCDHNLKPIVDNIIRFDEAPIAFHYMRNASHFGKIVVSME